ncbi:MAG: hemerythrin domain-containing protein [Deltaproteobacteria bacterium]|nr:hemerythrin domain-containing protein [Deltaproteobacteria bacterium]MBW2384945.1 hemerythrin domain-containing protein [Deltaproteobacteria bacterium]
MTPDEIRAKFLEDHAHLRGKASVLRSLACQVLRGDSELTEAMRLKGRDMQFCLIKHMQWEEAKLAPLLRSVNTAAADGADQLFEEHRGQRAKLADSLIALEGADDGDGTALAEHLLSLIRWLERDMQTEEKAILMWIDSNREPQHTPRRHTPRA